jgi:hypothetical protein
MRIIMKIRRKRFNIGGGCYRLLVLSPIDPAARVSRAYRGGAQRPRHPDRGEWQAVQVSRVLARLPA